MSDGNETVKNPKQFTSDFLKSWTMTVLTFTFVSLYIAALFGVIGRLEDTSIITRLEPIIFVIIGYYFGRLPAQATEKTLKTEINRQSQKADAAQQIKERAQQEREVLEEKLKNAKLTLTPQASVINSEKIKGAVDVQRSAGNTNQAIETALKILDS